MVQSYYMETITLCSRDSARRFIRLFLSINGTPYWYHQTLTFKGKVLNEQSAKNDLKILLDSLEKAYPQMACFWVREFREEEGGLHFHVIFLFFGQQKSPPERMRETFGADVFGRWNKIHGNTLYRRANLMKLRAKNFECIWYLTKYIKLCSDTKRALHWYGIRNKEMIDANYTPPIKQEVAKLLRHLFDDTGRGKPFKQRVKIVRRRNGNKEIWFERAPSCWEICDACPPEETL